MQGTNDNKPKKKYYQEEVRYYVREDGHFIPIYTEERPKVYCPEEKKVKPFNVDSYEIFKHENEYVYSSEDEYYDDVELLDTDEDGLGPVGMEEVRETSSDDSSDDETTTDEEYESGEEESTTVKSDTDTCWDEDPEQINELEFKDLKPYTDEIMKRHKKRPFPKKWKPNPYVSSMVYRDKITESDKEEMQMQKKFNTVKTDDLKMPSDEENFVLPKHGDVNYMGELPIDPKTPYIPWWEHEKEFADLSADESEIEDFPDRGDYQSDFVTDTSEEFSTVTDVDTEDLSSIHSSGPEYPDVKPEEYMEPVEMNAGDHQYQKIPEYQPEVRTWYDWHGHQYVDMKNLQGDWVTVEQVKEEYPAPKPINPENYWQRKAEEHGLYPKKCSPYEYPPDEDGYYHYCPGYNHIPGTENWGFYKRAKKLDVLGDGSDGDAGTGEDGNDKGEDDDCGDEDEDGDEDGDDDDGDRPVEKEVKKEKTELESWQNFVTQSLRPTEIDATRESHEIQKDITKQNSDPHDLQIDTQTANGTHRVENQRNVEDSYTTESGSQSQKRWFDNANVCNKSLVSRRNVLQRKLSNLISIEGKQSDRDSEFSCQSKCLSPVLTLNLSELVRGCSKQSVKRNHFGGPLSSESIPLIGKNIDFMKNLPFVNNFDGVRKNNVHSSFSLLKVS